MAGLWAGVCVNLAITVVPQLKVGITQEVVLLLLVALTCHTCPHHQKVSLLHIVMSLVGATLSIHS